MENNVSQLSRLNQWIQESITIKLFSIGFLVLILLIPTSWISSLVRERQGRAEEVMNEVSDKWSGSQSLSGPILVIPYRATERIDRGKEGVEFRDYTEHYYFLPETLDVQGEVNPEKLHRGIFDVAVYSSVLNVKAGFVKPDFNALSIAADRILWKDAYMIFSITDLRGISDNPVFTVGGKTKVTEPASNLGVSFRNGMKNTSDEDTDVDTDPEYSTNGILARLGWQSPDDFEGATSVSLNLKGSQSLSFVPTGKITTVKLAGPWNNPSFDGEFLPETREITETDFRASWKVLHYNRPFAQQWIGSSESLAGSEFGVRLLIPVDQYQKSIRTSKYGELIIILTFVALFLVEIVKKIRIHPFQYILIGAALIIYYTLLLSLSEQIGYNIAYWVATAATTTLISFYSVSFLKMKSLVALFSSLLVIFYSFIFIIILQQDFSLLLGSIGLFMIIAALMYFSRKVQWYGEASV